MYTSGAVVVLIAFMANLALSSPLYPNLESKIVGGQNTNIARYPFQVSIRINGTGQHNCGGTIINSKWILTAAHCFHNLKPQNVYIVAGSTNASDTRAERYGVSAIVVNKNFNISKTGNDTAVAKIFGKFNFTNPNIKVANLSASYIPGSVNVTAIGWGVSNVTTNYMPNLLQELNMTTVSHQKCTQNISVSTTELCVFKKNGTGVCFGDSGGPLVLPNTNIVVGIASWVAGGCANNLPDVYTRVANYTYWITNNTDSWNSTYLDDYASSYDFFDYDDLSDDWYDDDY